MASNHEDPSARSRTLVEVIVDGFTGEGLDGQLDAHVLVDQEPTQSVTFMLSEQDRSAVHTLSDTDVSAVWRTALDEMTSRLGAELGYAGTRALTHPIVVQSRLDARATSEATVPPDYHNAGALLAQFAV